MSGLAGLAELLGLAGSLVVGMLELFAGHGQNRFYTELEEWLSSITRIGLSSGDADRVGSDHSAAAGIVDSVALQIETLKDVVLRAEDTPLPSAECVGARAFLCQKEPGSVVGVPDSGACGRLAAV